jgi:hypothetical protein
MEYKRAKLCAVFLLGLGLTGLYAQEVLPASGGDATGSGGSVSYSYGQVVYFTNTGTNGSLIEGVQQPYEISVLTGIPQAGYIKLFCMVYPNPAFDLLTLEVEITDFKNLFYQLFEINGKLLVSKKLVDKKTTISMVNLAPATYFLKITDNQEVFKTFKIIKPQ